MKITAYPESLCPGQKATLMATDFASEAKSCTWTIKSHSCECLSLPNLDYPASIRVQALPHDPNGGTIRVYAVAGKDSATKVFTVHGIHIDGTVTVPKGQHMDPGVKWENTNHDRLCFGGGRWALKGLKVIGRAKLQLAGNCERQAECAQNFELGFLQNVIHHERVTEYERGRSVTMAKGQIANGSAPNLPLGLRDAEKEESVFCMGNNESRRFTGNEDEQTVEFFDNPGMHRDIESRKLGKLTGARMEIRFQTWLTVRNVAWYEIDRDASMIYLCSYVWRTRGDWGWDGKRVLRNRSEIDVKHVEPGKGSRDPILNGPVASDLTTEKTFLMK